MATQAKFYARAVRTLTGTPIPRASFGEKAASTFKRGALVFLDTSGRLTECGADPTLVIGVAAEDGKNNAADFGANCLVELAVPGTLFRFYADNGGSEGTGVLATTDIGKAYGVFKSAAGGYWAIDNADATNDRLVVLESWGEPGYAITDVRPHVLAHFCAAVMQMSVGT